VTDWLAKKHTMMAVNLELSPRLWFLLQLQRHHAAGVLAPVNASPCVYADRRRIFISFPVPYLCLEMHCWISCASCKSGRMIEACCSWSVFHGLYTLW